jgi:hypothetical protein
MRQPIVCTLIGLTFLFVLGSLAAHVNAAPITFEFTGVWRDGFFADGSGPVQPGDPFRGRFFFDPDAIASIPFISDCAVVYRFNSGGASLELNVTTAAGVITFRSDSAAMYAEVVNNCIGGDGTPDDRFLLEERDLFELGYATHLNRGAGLYVGL